MMAVVSLVDASYGAPRRTVVAASVCLFPAAAPVVHGAVPWPRPSSHEPQRCEGHSSATATDRREKFT